MPANKNALIRYKTIDRCLRNRFRLWTIDDLTEACSDALFLLEPIPQATRVFDPRALGLTQIKAAGLVQTSGLLLPKKLSGLA